jgi:hypothetical protein
MASRTGKGSWSGSDNAAWGLTTKVGPWKETPADLQKFNSRAGGPHAGHGNWYQSFNPKPYIQTLPTPGIPYYRINELVTSEDFETPRGLKIPGVNRAGSKGAAGGRMLHDSPSTSSYGINNSSIENGPKGHGTENIKITSKEDKAIPERVIKKPIDSRPKPPGLDLSSIASGAARSSLSNASSRVGSMKRHSTPSSTASKHNDFRPQTSGYGLHKSPDYTHHNAPGGINMD